MKVDLHRYSHPVAVARLPEVLRGVRPQAEPMLVTADFSGVEAALADQKLELPTPVPKHQRSKYDSAMVEPVHRALSGLITRRDSVDPCFWHWLCTATQLREYVWLRWHGSVPADIDHALSDSDLSRRFLGSATLVGVSRNALARLYWTAEAMAGERQYELARIILSDTDLHMGLFERSFCLHPDVARAVTEELVDVPVDTRRAVLRQLNRFATTRVLEVMDESEIRTLLVDLTAAA